MIILIEDGCGKISNLGDAAMLHVCARRLREIFPDARIFNLCRDPNRLPLVTAECDIIPELHRDNLEDQTPFYGRTSHLIPFNRKGDGCRHPRAVLTLLRLRRMILRADPPDHLKFLDLLSKADLVVAAGGGYLTDIFSADTNRRFITLETAARLGKPLAFLGQGIGPFIDKEFQKRTLGILSKAKLIALREARRSPGYCKKNGVMSPYIVTGDDAVELGWENRPEALADRIGINCRMANYSGVNEEQKATLTTAFKRLGEKTPGKQLLPLPISHYRTENDTGAVIALAGADAVEPYPSPEEISFDCFFSNLRRCRLVVTGSYHAMIFALSAGIPAVGLVASEYYENKFLGAVDQFGSGAAIVDLRSPDFLTEIARITDEFWDEAENLRPGLLLAAERQITMGREVYQRIPDLISVPGRPLKALTSACFTHSPAVGSAG